MWIHFQVIKAVVVEMAAAVQVLLLSRGTNLWNILNVHIFIVH